jgi:hypothetical protein
LLVVGLAVVIAGPLPVLVDTELVIQVLLELQLQNCLVVAAH